ncbi:hypothetical protein [Tautonia plasticadhaerens]|uniref:Uncharacterized protein n=1 Tax=Tautonia plasticadhaerens TaxID=2527974 RepID=A0A518GVJ8_9BACT|nr:hypothetical protein [Tautonia plasticadhaerens]QDV32630.1 hypothetical protein ElP_04650 [Tautonia plasticadhaerens]
MMRCDRMVLGLAALLAASGTAAAQSWSAGDARRMHNFVEYGVPDPGYVPNAYFVDPPTSLPPNAYARRATPGGLIETAARRLNPFSAPSRASDITFAPAPYRQGPPAGSYRVMRPPYGPAGYHYSMSGAVTPMASPTTTGGALVPGVNCPTCPR